MRFLLRWLLDCGDDDSPRRVVAIAAVALIVLVVFHWCAPAQAARGRAPTVHPDFDVECVQGEVCAAPALVRLDAWATTADQVPSPAHRLVFDWQCGSDETPPASGPIGACLFEKPGTFTIWLRAERPEFTPPGAKEPLPAETTFLSKRVVVVAPPPAQLVNERTACERRGPGVVHCALPAGARVAAVPLPAGPGVLTSAPGAPAIVTGQFTPPAGWTTHRVDFEGGCLSLPPERSNVTLFDVNARGCRQGAFVIQTGGGTRHNDLIGVARSELSNVPGLQVPAIYARASRMVVIESALSADYYPFRTVHFSGLLLARNQFNASGPHACAQLRAWSGLGPPQDPSERAVVVDNVCVAATPAAGIWRTCESGTCEGAIGTIRDVIFRGNQTRIVGRAAPPSSLYWLEGDAITVEGETVEAPAADMTTQGTVRFVSQFNTGGNGIAARDNRVVLPAGRRAVVDCELRGVGNVCERNAIERTP